MNILNKYETVGNFNKHGLHEDTEPSKSRAVTLIL